MHHENFTEEVCTKVENFGLWSRKNRRKEYDMVPINWPLIDAEIHPTAPPEQVAQYIPKGLREQLAQATASHIQQMEFEGSQGKKVYDLEPETGRRRRPRGTSIGKLGPFFHPVTSPVDVKRYMGVNGAGGAVIYGAFSPTDKRLTQELAVAQVRAVNDWSYDMYGKDLDVFAPAAGSPIWYSPEEAIKELERVAKRGGLRPYVIPTHIDHLHYNRPDYERFWAAVNEIGIPLGCHIASHGRDPRPFSNPGGAVPNFLMQAIGAMEPVALMVCAGVFERYPNIKTNYVECDIGWLAWFVNFLDRANVWHQHWVSPKLLRPPSEYVKEHCLFTFASDPAGLALTTMIGTDMIAWGSDFPHHEGTWPYSRDALEEDFAVAPHLTLADKKKITHGNLARWFNLKVDMVFKVTEAA
jgi:predicted TIM-barrel fold metal-dependent hydrolase